MNLSLFATLLLLLDAAPTLGFAAKLGVQTSSSFQEQKQALKLNLSHQHSAKSVNMASTPTPSPPGAQGHSSFFDPVEHPHVIWSTSGGGMRSMVANIGYASIFAALGLITENSTKFSGISSTSGGSWFTLLLFFSRPFFDAIVSSTPDEVATLVTNLTSAFASVQPDSPSSVSQFCQDIQKYVSFSSTFDDILSTCSFTADWEKFVTAFLQNAAARYGDDALADRLVSGENVISPLSDAWLQIQMSVGATARSSDLLNISYFGPSDSGELQTTPVPLSWGTGTTKGGAWFPLGVTNQSATVVQATKTFNTNDYSYSNLFPAPNDAPRYSPNHLGVETVESLKMPIPFGGEPLLTQLAAASSAAAAATTGAIPSSFAQTISFMNTTRQCNPILSSSILDSASTKALDYAANQIWSTAALDKLSVCSDDSGDCTAPFSRLMDGAYSDNIALATNIARYQDVHGAQGPSSTCLRAIVTNNNMYSDSNFNMVSFFNTSFNQGIEPGGFLWPTSWAMNNTIPHPRRSPQIFAECMSVADLDEALVSIPGTNFSTAVLRGTTINNDAFGVEAGLCVSILLLQTNSDIPILVLPPNAQAYQNSFAELAKSIASNDLIKETVASFLEGEGDVPAPNFSCSFAEEKNIPACEPKKLSPSDVLEAITANDNWCTLGNTDTASSINCDQYLQAISTFNTPIPTMPVWLVACSIAVAWLGPLLYLALSFKKGKKKKSEESNAAADVSYASAKEIKLVGLNVVSSEGAKILENVSLHLKPATMNGLLGLSGSGKSTLLGVLSQSLRPNLRVSTSNESSNISELNYAFLRQNDSVDMDSMTPVEYLRATARILGTPDKRLHFVLDSLRSMFPLKKEVDKDGQEKITLDPFNSTRIAELSGGQRRMVAIGSKLFDEPSILLLDEPLSGLDSASSIELINMLHLFIEKTGLIVLMILHQPSDEILEAMDSITIMMKGQIAFHEDKMNFIPEIGPAQFVHEMLRDGTSTGKADSSLSLSATGTEGESVGSTSHCIPRSVSIVQSSVFKSKGSSRLACLSDTIEQQEGLESSITTRVSVSEYLNKVHYDTLRRRQPSVQSSPRAIRLRAAITSRFEDLVSNATYFFKQLPQAIAKDFTLLWQVQPLLRRMQLHVGTPWMDFGVILVVLVVAGWSQYASSFEFGINDLIQLSIFMLGCVIPFGNTKLFQHFDFVHNHLHDLKDRKVSALAFLLASSIRLISLSVPAAFAAYAVAFALNGWDFALYLETVLLAAFFMLNIFQLAKVIALCMKDIHTFGSAYLAYCATAITFSGILAAPVDVDPSMRIFMYLSLQYWSYSGTLVGWLSAFAYVDTSYFEEIANPIIAAEFVPRFANYELLTNPKKSLLLLFFVFPFLSMIEYVILLVRTTKKPNQYGRLDLILRFAHP